MLNIIRQKNTANIFPAVWIEYEGTQYVLVFDDLSVFESSDWIELDNGRPYLCRKLVNPETKHISLRAFKPEGVFEASEEGWQAGLKLAEELNKTFVFRVGRLNGW